MGACWQALLSCTAQVFSSSGYRIRAHPHELNIVSEFALRHMCLVDMLALWAWVGL